MAKMLFEDKIVEVELPFDTDVVGILLDNGQHVKIGIKVGTYREYTPTDAGGMVNGPTIYTLRPVNDPDTLMVGFTRNIIATYYHSPWTPE